MTEQLLHTTTSLCKHCKNAVAASVVRTANHEVVMRKQCSQHGAQEVMLSNNAEWYVQTRSIAQRPVPPRVFSKPVEHGCPFDCGACASHTQKVRLPVVTITSACNLDCPICYVHNKNNDAYFMDIEDFKRILEHLQHDHGGELDIINLTGGEPTLHPQILEFVALAKAAGIHRTTVCSNGVRLVKDPEFVEKLAALDARIALSFDTFDHAADYLLQGAHLVEMKMRCLDLLDAYGVNTTLIPVMTRGVNEHEVGDIIRYAMGKSCVRHLELHTMTYTGQGGVSFERSGRISMYEVLQEIEKTTAGLLAPGDFVPSPCAHPLCYQIAYLLIDPAGQPIPFTHFMSSSELYAALSDRLYLEPTPALEEAMRSSIDRLWAQDDPAQERTLALLKRLLGEMFPQRAISQQEAMRAGERAIKAVYIHSHMDEENFDVERARDCCDSNCYADGTTIPVCNYNVLYREKEAKFMDKPRSWNERSGGTKQFPHSLPVIRG